MMNLDTIPSEFAIFFGEIESANFTSASASSQGKRPQATVSFSLRENDFPKFSLSDSECCHVLRIPFREDAVQQFRRLGGATPSGSDLHGHFGVAREAVGVGLRKPKPPFQAF